MAKEGKLTLVSADGFRLAKVSLDYDNGEGQAPITRDTVHPRAEGRQGRVSKDEASILLKLVKLIHNELATRFSEGGKEWLAKTS